MSMREEWLRHNLARLMEVDVDQLSLTQPFVEQGVDSLTGLRLSRELQDALNAEVELEWLLDYANIRDLALFLDQRFGQLREETLATTNSHRDCA